MLYLRDEFLQHPKFEGWSPADRWRLLELMGYLSRYSNGSRGAGKVPSDLSLLPRSVTIRVLDKAIISGWLDQHSDGSLWFHDWHIYNTKDATNAERQARYRARRNVTGYVTSNAEDVTAEPLLRARGTKPSHNSNPKAVEQGTEERPEDFEQPETEPPASELAESEFVSEALLREMPA